MRGQQYPRSKATSASADSALKGTGEGRGEIMDYIMDDDYVTEEQAKEGKRIHEAMRKKT